MLHCRSLSGSLQTMRRMMDSGQQSCERHVWQLSLSEGTQVSVASGNL
jgi:hypothetical protein